MNKRKYIVLLSVLNVLRSVFLIGQALLSKMLVDAAIKKGEWIPYAIGFGALVLLNIGTSIVFLDIRNRFSLKIEVGLKQQIYDALIRKDVAEAKRFHSGEITNIYLSDIQNIKSGLCETIPNIFLYASRFLLAFFAMIYFDWRLLLILLAIGAVSFAGARIYSKKMKKYHKECLESDGSVNAFMQESFENIRIVKAMNSEGSVCDSLQDRLKENYARKQKRNRLSLIGNGGLFSLMEISLLLTMIYAAYGLSHDFMTVGTLTGLLQIVSYFEGPLSMASSLLTRYNAYKASDERIRKLYDLKEDHHQKQLGSFDKIAFEDVSFAYDRQVIRHFSMEIHQGDTVLLKGQSGSGKSTVFSLLLGFLIPTEGEINVYVGDHHYPVKNCRHLFSYVAQENILFSGTIEENIRLFVDDASPDRIRWALKTACVYDEIMQKPEGLRTSLNERGNGLSLGQIQRILLAIALLKDHPVLLLDEFTSALDKELEKKIVMNVASLNRTKIIITHRDIFLPDAKTVYIGEEDE